MTEFKHTKGHWITELANVTTKDRLIANCIGNGVSITEEDKANAKLIAAAPELLDALIEIIKTASPEHVIKNKEIFGLNLGEFYVGGCGIPSNKSIHMAIDAIKKATE